MKIIVIAGLIFALCIAVVPASALPVCGPEDWADPVLSNLRISSQTAGITDVITIEATVDDRSDDTCDGNPCAVVSDVSATFMIEGPGGQCIAPSDCGIWPDMDPVSSPSGPVLDFRKDIDLGRYDLQPGIYTVYMKGMDGCNHVSSDADNSFTLVVYDPSGGFVTGGGWIDSPEGAYAGDLTLAGRANFGFVSKYLKGATVPTGQTQFQFKVGNLNFHSTSYDWLVVAGAKAQYKGTGTINNEGSFRFMLTAVDGQLLGNGGPDRFRIRIWENIEDQYGNVIENRVYDNQPGDPDSTDPTTAIAGGSIVIHKH